MKLNISKQTLDLFNNKRSVLVNECYEAHINDADYTVEKFNTLKEYDQFMEKFFNLKFNVTDLTYEDIQ